MGLKEISNTLNYLEREIIYMDIKAENNKARIGKYSEDEFYYYEGDNKEDFKIICKANAIAKVYKHQNNIISNYC